MKWAITALLIPIAAAGIAAAQEIAAPTNGPARTDYVMPRIPSEAEKVEALKSAYRLNGNSMVGYNMMVDLTDPEIQKADKIVKTVPIKPEAPPPQAARPVEKRAEVQDTCRRHGLRKIVTGSSWRCRK